jgi:alginate biosynthesis protein Alg44
MATESNNTNIVHESETQRRHSRVKLPSSLVISAQDGKKLKLPILDLSATGFAFSSEELQLSVGEFSHGSLVFKFDSLEIGLDVKFQVVGVHGEKNTRYGCEFHELGREEIATLRTIITKFLSGEVTNVKDILSTLSRDNFAKPRQDAVSKALTGSEKFRALLFTTAFVFLSLLAFAYVLFSIQQHFFVVKATTALISTEANGLFSARNGQVEMLVKSGDKIAKGQPLAIISSPLLTDVSTLASAANMESSELDKLLERAITSTMVSPCDCTVLSTSVITGQFVSQGQQLFLLNGINSKSKILARFNYADVSELTVGTKVLIDLVDGNTTLKGTIIALTIPENIRLEEHRVHAVLATIEPETTLPLSLSNHPVIVKVGDFAL